MSALEKKDRSAAAAPLAPAAAAAAPALAPGSSGVFLFDDPSAARAGPMRVHYVRVASAGADASAPKRQPPNAIS